ncbi:MAG: V-type ATP synthase subunit D [Lachnospiraceae bacterium]|nr:V-type ATP synthase subunit D [Lachnospiraceae bacterium]
MNPNTFPTKGNLMLAKNSLQLANTGYELMDKKRNILIRELMELIEKATNIQNEIDSTFSEAYQALENVNKDMGLYKVKDISKAIPEEESIKIKTRSIMGTEIPLVEHDRSDIHKPDYAFHGMSVTLDDAVTKFKKVKELIIKLSTVETSAYRLAASIKKTQKRANALQNITIPYYSTLAVEIENALEEKEREEFSRLKVIKQVQTKKRL